jgi:hydroxyacylglutathione hydrolase
VTLEPGNSALSARADEVNQQRAKSQATVPSLLQDELDTNPFMRPHSTEIRAKLGFDTSAADVDVFAAIRKHKDSF